MLVATKKKSRQDFLGNPINKTTSRGCHDVLQHVGVLLIFVARFFFGLLHPELSHWREEIHSGYGSQKGSAFPADLETEATASGPTSVAEKIWVVTLAQRKLCDARKKFFSRPLVSLEESRAGAMGEPVLLLASAAITVSTC
ncbi:hypothetical protein Chor_001547 [Crotalus horridus]